MTVLYRCDAEPLSQFLLAPQCALKGCVQPERHVMQEAWCLLPEAWLLTTRLLAGRQEHKGQRLGYTLTCSQQQEDARPP